MTYTETPNIYYSPEALGFTPVAGIDVAGSWEFAIFAVWERGDTFYWATDSGCSCPSPFEDTNVSDLSESRDREAVLRAFHEWLDRSCYIVDRAEVSSFVDQVNRYGR